ncbi:hypothetical protein DFH29DRAFT_1083988 [Suillus ampliporus]|nr:hypothetical protein DFH29DRAFT_1083988 [Suillus ampliporus]
MPYVSNDPASWPVIYSSRITNYFVVASLTTVVYDWALTFGQEFELVWMHRWSLMTVLYICVRYLGILFSVLQTLASLPVSITDEVSTILYFLWIWIPVVVNAMLGVIMMIRIHAMYQRSRMMLIFLAVVLLTATIASAVISGMANIGVSGVEKVLSGYHLCGIYISPDDIRLDDETFIPTTVWEILAWFLAVWIVIKHFRELRQSPTGSTAGDCFTVLIQSHMLYFVAFATMSCFYLGELSSKIQFSSSTGSAAYFGIFQITQMVQMFVLGPRLILSVREYHTKLVTDSDEGTGMTSITFQEGGHVSTGGVV